MSQKREGRFVGILLLLQLAAALIVPFVLMTPLVKGYPAFLETAAASSAQIRSGITLSFVGAGLTLALAVWTYPVLSLYSKRAGLWLFAVFLVSAALDAVHAASVASMQAAGERIVDAVGTDITIYHSWAAAAASMRRSAHIAQLVAIAAWMGSFYISALRFRLVPRPLAALGIAGVASQFTGVTVMMILGYPILGYLAFPIAPVHVATAVWLIMKGFPRSSGEPRPSGA
jgi:hypothetical protein